MVDRGAERFTGGLYAHLSDRFDIDIWSIKDTGTKYRDDIRIPWRNGRAYMEAYLFGRRWYKEDRTGYDVVLNNAGLGGSYWCNHYRRRTGTPFITFERGGGREELINYLFKPDVMVCLTEASRSMLCKKHLPHVETVVLPIGIDLECYRDGKTTELVEGLEHPIFLSTSALVKFKRIELIIKAVERLGKGSLVQTSTGDQKDGIVSFGEKLLGDNFRYIGVIGNDELVDVYHSCDVFVNASRREAFGVVYLEAMASGLPIVTQRDERRMELIDGAGVFVDCEDISDFADALSTASLSKSSGMSLMRAEQYSWKRLKPLYVELIEEVVG